MRTLLLIFLLLLASGCAREPSPVTVTVASTTATPTIQPALPQPTLTVRATPTTAIIPTISPTPLPAEQVALEQVVTGLNNRDDAGLTALAADPFFYGIYGVDIMTATLETGLPYEISTYLADSYRVRELAISADPFAFLPPRIDLESLNPTTNPTEVIYLSNGWGDEQTGQALLYFTRSEDELRWQGIIVSFNNFATVPNYPIGELSAEQQAVLTTERNRQQQLEQLDAQFPYDPDGAPRPFFSVNPSGTLAVGQYGAPLEDGSTLSLYNFATDTYQPIALPETGNSDFPVWQARSISANWLDDERVLFGYVADANDEGPVGGHPALLNVTTEEATSLDAESMMFWRSNASVTTDQAMLFIADVQPRIWRDGNVTMLETEGFNLTGVISADGSQVVLAKKVNVDANSNGGIAWVSHDLQTGQETQLLTSDGTIAAGFGEAFINASGSWVAIDVNSDLAEELGVWVISADGTQKTHLGIGTRAPLWLDHTTIIFTAIVNGAQQTHLFDAATGERFSVAPSQ